MSKNKVYRFIAFIIFITAFNSVFAEDILTSISVNYNTVKSIILNQKEIIPPEGEKPFEYNGRTYVPLRFVSENLDKYICWDDRSESVYISDILFEDDFSGELWDNWSSLIKYGYFDITEDNTLRISQADDYVVSFSDRFITVRSEKIPEELSEFALEVELMTSEVIANDYRDSMAMQMGFVVGSKVNYKDKMPRFNWAIAGVQFGVALNKNIQVPEIIKGKIHVPFGKFYKLKVIIKQTEAEYYLDDQYMLTQNFDFILNEHIKTIYDADFNVGLFGTVGENYFKNFKVISAYK